MCKKEKLSLIVSTYRSEQFLPQFFVNILGLKDLFDLEVVIIMNDPSCGEIECIEKMLDNYCQTNLKEKIKIIKVDREPLYCSWNRGLEISTNETILITNIDDYVYPDAISDILRGMNKDKKFILGSGPMDTLNKDKFLLSQQQNQNIQDIHMCFISGAFVFKKNDLTRNMYFNEKYSIVADYDFQLQALERGGKIFFHKNSVGIYRNFQTGLSTSKGVRLTIEQQLLYLENRIYQKLIMNTYLLYLCARIEKINPIHINNYNVKNNFALKRLLYGIYLILKTLIHRYLISIFKH